MLKKRIKILVILGVISLIDVGLFGLSKIIVNKGYSSEASLIKEEQEKKDNQNKVSVYSKPKDVGNHGENYTPGETYGDGEPLYLTRIKDILNHEDSPYKELDCTISEEDLSNGEKRFYIMSNKDIVLEVYGNSTDYAPYMFTSKTDFSLDQDEFFSSLQNGKTGYNEETKEYYWLYY